MFSDYAFRQFLVTKRVEERIRWCQLTAFLGIVTLCTLQLTKQTILRDQQSAPLQALSQIQLPPVCPTNRVATTLAERVACLEQDRTVLTVRAYERSVIQAAKITDITSELCSLYPECPSLPRGKSLVAGKCCGVPNDEEDTEPAVLEICDIKDIDCWDLSGDGDEKELVVQEDVCDANNFDGGTFDFLF